MKRSTKKRMKKWIIAAAAVAAAAAAVALAVHGVRSLTGPEADTTEGLKYIKAAETQDIKEIEQKISSLEKQDGEAERSVKERFSGAVVMGDSIARGFTDYDVLNPSSVAAKIGVHLDELEDQVELAKKLSPQVIFLSYGMNDIAAGSGDTEAFISRYSDLVDLVRKEMPDAHLFINSVFPARDHAVEEEPALENVPEYNEALKKMCDEKQIGFIDNTELASAQYYEEDGIHFKAAFYPLWAEHMAEVASL